MRESEPDIASIYAFATWEPLLRFWLDVAEDRRTAPSIQVPGRISRRGWSVKLLRKAPPPGRALQTEDMQDELRALKRVQAALSESGLDDISFTAEISATGRAVLHLLGPSPAVEPGIDTAFPGELILVEGSVPEPWRRLPEQVPDAVPASSVDLELLERTLRERLPDAVGATEQEIADAEARLGVALPAELKVLYRVTRGRWEDFGGDYGKAAAAAEAVGCEMFTLEQLHITDPMSRYLGWGHGAMQAVVTPPDAAVQGLVASPGWIAFGDNGGGDHFAIDLTPGPRGHVGQVIMISHEEETGAGLIADSLTDLVLGRGSSHRQGNHRDQPPVVAHVNIRRLRNIEAAAHPAVEAVSIGLWEDDPVSLAPLIGLPRLRTLAAHPGTLADPLEIAELTGLEFLSLGPQEWRVLLDAGAVPRSLAAAGVKAHGAQNVMAIGALANEILSLWDRPLIPLTIIEGDLGPAD